MPAGILLFVGLLFAATTPGALTVSWSTLKTLDSAKANTPASALNNKAVAIPGFIVPLEDDVDQVTEFLLVPYAGACIHVPPPPPNQMIYVKLAHSQKTKMTAEPVTVTGHLHVTTVQSPYGDVSFNMDGESIKPYEQ